MGRFAWQQNGLLLLTTSEFGRRTGNDRLNSVRAIRVYGHKSFQMQKRLDLCAIVASYVVFSEVTTFGRLSTISSKLRLLAFVSCEVRLISKLVFCFKLSSLLYMLASCISLRATARHRHFCLAYATQCAYAKNSTAIPLGRLISVIDSPCVQVFFRPWTT